LIDEEDAPRPLASRRFTWPVLAITALQFAGTIGDAVDTACGNLIMALGMHLNHTYDRDDQAREDAPHIRAE
jgi:hypothetical protein